MLFRSFDAPEYLKGERILLKFDQILSEAWIYVNGRLIENKLHAYHPFEVDITAAFKPGQKNEILVQVRDWLSWAPLDVPRANGVPS